MTHPFIHSLIQRQGFKQLRLPQTHFIAKDDPKFTILLPPPPHLPGLQPYHARFMQCCVRNPDPYYLHAHDAGILPAQAASQPANDIFKQVVSYSGSVISPMAYFWLPVFPFTREVDGWGGVCCEHQGKSQLSLSQELLRPSSPASAFFSLRAAVEEVKVSYRESASQPLILSPQT